MEHLRNEQIEYGSLLKSPRKRDGTGKKTARFILEQHLPTAAAADASQVTSNAPVAAADNDDTYQEIKLDVVSNPNALPQIKKVTAGHDKYRDPEEVQGTTEKKSSLAALLSPATSPRFQQVSMELKKLALRPKWPGQGIKTDGSKSVVAHALKGLVFVSKSGGNNGWPAVEKRFDELAVDGSLPKSLFGHCIGMKESKEFVGVLFDALARRMNTKTCCITKEELKIFWEQISEESFDSRLQTFFDMVDKNADGRLTEDEVREIISLSASANKLSQIQQQAEEYARLIMEELDPDNLGYVEIHNLETLLLQAPSLSVDHGRSKNLSQMLSAKLKPTKEPNPLRRWYQNSKYFLLDNWQRVWVIALWLSICAGLFTWKFFQFRQRAIFHVLGYCVCTAKGAAETLKFNMALVLLPVCRNSITWLRNTKLVSAVPFDDNLKFHKVIAVGIIIGTIFHAGPLMACNYTRHIHSSDFWWFVKNIESSSGIIMVVIMMVAFTFATPMFRRSRLKLPKPLKKLTGFNTFWYTHHLFITVYILHIIHGVSLYFSKIWLKKTTWMYVAIPVIIYMCERFIRLFRSGIRPVKIQKVAMYPGNVLALHFSRPRRFKYQSGQYIFVNCAEISAFQWSSQLVCGFGYMNRHPFSITSAPQDGYISVHIRTAGDWTRQLQTIFSKVCRSSKSEKGKLCRSENNRDGKNNNPIFPKILVDGPYGAPAQDYKKYDVVLLVGLGIGATPFISILKDIVNNMKLLNTDTPQHDHESGFESDSSTSSFSGQASKRMGYGSSFKTKRAYFYWVTREQGSFEWFKGVMDEIAESDKMDAIELHNYCTSVYEEGDARSALIAMLQLLQHAKNGYDVVSGTRVKSHFARPNWRNVYKRIALNHPDQHIGVFYCGAATLANELRQLASDFSRKTTTKFVFHKENF